MGDFNYEPFDRVLSDDLWATRDRVMASRRNGFLYNPFWRYLSERDLFHQNATASEQLCGTHFYKQGKITRWRTVDQIMFSSSFINSGEWYLDERYSLIWKDENLSLKLFRKSGLDHFPITSAVIFDPKVEA